MLERLSSEDARILALETGPIVGHTAKIAIAERAAADTVAALRDRLEQRLVFAPRLHQRLAPTPLHLAAPAWVDDPSFDPSAHVRRVEIEGHLDRERLREIAASLMAQRLDRERPLWTIDLVDPLEGNLVAAIWRIHHCLADGAGALALGPVVLWDDAPDPASPPPAGRVPPPEPTPGTLELVAAAASERAQSFAASLARMVTAAAAPSGWRATIDELRRAPGTILRELKPAVASSPLDASIARTRRVALVDWPLVDVQRVAHGVAPAVTVNDVVLAAVAGGLRRWLRHRNRPADLVRVQVPVSMHRPDEEDATGNRDSFLNVDLPLDEADPVRRLLAIHGETQDRKDRHDADELYALFAGLSHVSRRLYGRAYRAASDPRVFALAVSNIRGPAEPRYLAGGRIREFYSLAEIAPRHALRVNCVSFGGRMSFGLCADAEALPDLDVVRDGIEVTLRELLEETS